MRVSEHASELSSRATSIPLVAWILALFFVFVVLLEAAPAFAYHNLQVGQATRNESPCCFEAQAGSTVFPDVANTLNASIKHGSQWYQGACTNCTVISSPWRAYSFPVTVHSNHAYTNGAFHNDTDSLSIWYP